MKSVTRILFALGFAFLLGCGDSKGPTVSGEGPNSAMPDPNAGKAGKAKPGAKP